MYRQLRDGHETRGQRHIPSFTILNFPLSTLPMGRPYGSLRLMDLHVYLPKVLKCF